MSSEPALPDPNLAEAQRLKRENDYLKQRVAQLQDDVTDLGGQVMRLQQERDRFETRRAAARAKPLSGGQ